MMLANATWRTALLGACGIGMLCGAGKLLFEVPQAISLIAIALGYPIFAMGKNGVDMVREQRSMAEQAASVEYGGLVGRMLLYMFCAASSFGLTQTFISG